MKIYERLNIESSSASKDVIMNLLPDLKADSGTKELLIASYTG